MQYVDGYLIVVPTDRIDEYRRMALKGAKIWREHGALACRECVGEDLDVPWGRTFPKTLKVKEGETVVFSWIVFKSRKDRDRINALVMKDPRLEGMDPASMPFDMKRMVVGGFTTLVSK